MHLAWYGVKVVYADGAWQCTMVYAGLLGLSVCGYSIPVTGGTTRRCARLDFSTPIRDIGLKNLFISEGGIENSTASADVKYSPKSEV